MSRSVAEQLTAQERLNHARPCGQTVKADLRPHTPASSSCDMREPAADALRLTTKQEAAAADAGISQSRLSHKLKDGSLTLAQMEAFGPTFAAAYGRELVERFGPLADTPAARLRQKAREVRAIAEELDQLSEFIA